MGGDGARVKDWRWAQGHHLSLTDTTRVKEFIKVSNDC